MGFQVRQNESVLDLLLERDTRAKGNKIEHAVERERCEGGNARTIEGTTAFAYPG